MHMAPLQQRVVLLMWVSVLMQVLLLGDSYSRKHCNFRSYTCSRIRKVGSIVETGVRRVEWSMAIASETESQQMLSLAKIAVAGVSKATVSIGIMLAIVGINFSTMAAADDELARYAAEGNKIGVDATCFIRDCGLETAQCGNDPTCLKGLSCLARCKGGSMCSTGCFAKFGSRNLDNMLSCSVEKHDCVKVPGKESPAGWSQDRLSDLPHRPLSSFDAGSLEGNWFKVMGLDSRYDCFDCQTNSFEKLGSSSLRMKALFRIPRPTSPGYLQSTIDEELQVVGTGEPNKAVVVEAVSSSSSSTSGDMNPPLVPHLQSKGEMFGLTFWENWYILGESNRLPSSSGLVASAGSSSEGILESQELKLVYYTGHTLQGSYKGAFLYSRSRLLTSAVYAEAADIIKRAGLDPSSFCIIRNQCFLSDPESRRPSAALPLTDSSSDSPSIKSRTSPYWFVGQNFFDVTKAMAAELADWFDDPAILSEWLLSQQQRMVLQQPLEVSPFASNGLME